MKKRIRKIHVDDFEWKYIVGVSAARIFPPNSKEAMAEIGIDHDWTHEEGYGFRPSLIKTFIQKELLGIWKSGKWVADGKTYIRCNKPENKS